MTIHSEFSALRVSRWRAVSADYPLLVSRRDSKRKKCYGWEEKHLRPGQLAFTDRQAAKGFARLCVKIAIRRMKETGTLHSEVVEAEMRASFSAAFTHETLSSCNASAFGAYFAKWGWTDVIIAHEIAHWADQWDHMLRHPAHTRVDYVGHGPSWLGWFAYIFAHARKPQCPDATIEWIVGTMRNERLSAILP